MKLIEKISIYLRTDDNIKCNKIVILLSVYIRYRNIY